MLSRRAFVGATAALAFGGLAACGSEAEPLGALDALRERGFARVGIADEAPFGFVTATGAVTGLGPEVARAAFRGLGVPRIEGLLAPFGELIDELRAGRCDVVASMMYVTVERCELVAFAAPVFVTPGALAVRADERRPLDDYRALRQARATLAVLDGAIELGDAQAAGLPASLIREFPDVASARAALELGRVDAIALTAPSIRRIVRQSGGALRAQPPFLPEIDGRDVRRYAAHAFRPSDTALRDAFNRELQALRTSGELVRIAQAQAFTASEVRGANDVSWKAACAG